MTELTKEQREALSWAADRAHVASLGKPIDGLEGRRWRVLKDLLTAHSTDQRMSDAAPEGCTPADARKLREANHRLVDENRRQARTIAFLRDQNRRIIEAAERIRDNAARAEGNRSPIDGDQCGTTVSVPQSSVICEVAGVTIFGQPDNVVVARAALEASTPHPDRPGGSHDAMTELNAALTSAEKELS